MIRKLMVMLLTGALCLLGVTPLLVKRYATLGEYEKLTGNKIEKFNEAPELRIKVAAGTLAPVEERLPQREDIYVVEPIEKIGQYGGTIYDATRDAIRHLEQTTLKQKNLALVQILICIII